MADVIPESIQDTLEPFLVRAGRWPEPDTLTRPMDDREEAEDPDTIEIDPSLEGNLLDSVKLVHGALRNEPAEERLFWSADRKDYYYKLFRKELEDPPEDGDSFAPWLQWQGWASWAPIKGNLKGFCIQARHDASRAPVDLEVAQELLGEVLTNKLRDELLDEAAEVVCYPGFEGPEHCAGSVALNVAGLGAQFPYLFFYTDGQQLLVAMQTIAHEPFGASGIVPL